MLKRVAIMLFCLMIVFVATFGFVVGVVAVPTIYSYAETTNNFEPIRDQSDAVYAFQAYCKSRDLTIEGSITDAVTSYTTDAYNYTCNKIGVNPTELQAEIHAEYDQAGKPIKFLFSSVGVDAFNRIFSQFLQDNELEVGYTDVNKTVYSGSIFTDKDGNNCLVYIVSTSQFYGDNSKVLYYGTPYKYTGKYINSLENNTYLQFHITDNTNIYKYKNVNRGTAVLANSSGSTGGMLMYGYYNDGTVFNNSDVVIMYDTSTSKYYWGSVGIWHAFPNGLSSQGVTQIDMSSATNRSTNIILISTQINNNTYQGDTIINNEGDVIVEPDPVPPGGTDPGWDIGGGGGTATDGNGNTWNIQFPDFELPDLNIDWSINGLGEKFPFSIPFDLVALVTVLNAEPQAPRFEGTVNFGFTTWNYDINLQQFDSVAQACRIAELLLLVVGLILVTRSIIKG